jgi:uncharacterized coiled-coil protein SlyX
VRRRRTSNDPPHRASDTRQTLAQETANNGRLTRLESTIAELRRALDVLNVRLAALQAQVDHYQAKNERL